VAATPVAAAPIAAAPTVIAPVTTAPKQAPAPTVSTASAPVSAGAKKAVTTNDDDERQARKKQRKREAIGAALAFFWVIVAVGLLGGIVYGSYSFWISSAPKEVRVPSYVGKHQDDARILLSKAGLQMTVRQREIRPDQASRNGYRWRSVGRQNRQSRTDSGRHCVARC
jgi:hypothetical protein